MSMETNDKRPVQTDDFDVSLSNSETSSESLKSQAQSERPQSGEQPSAQKEKLPQANNHKEKGGYENTREPTRYGDWEIAGRCVDF